MLRCCGDRKVNLENGGSGVGAVGWQGSSCMRRNSTEALKKSFAARSQCNVCYRGINDVRPYQLVFTLSTLLLSIFLFEWLKAQTRYNYYDKEIKDGELDRSAQSSRIERGNNALGPAVLGESTEKEE
jgi:hypothetical protein